MEEVPYTAPQVAANIHTLQVGHLCRLPQSFNSVRKLIYVADLPIYSPTSPTRGEASDDAVQVDVPATVSSLSFLCPDCVRIRISDTAAVHNTVTVPKLQRYPRFDPLFASGCFGRQLVALSLEFLSDPLPEGMHALCHLRLDQARVLRFVGLHNPNDDEDDDTQMIPSSYRQKLVSLDVHRCDTKWFAEWAPDLSALLAASQLCWATQ